MQISWKWFTRRGLQSRKQTEAKIRSTASIPVTQFFIQAKKNIALTEDTGGREIFEAQNVEGGTLSQSSLIEWVTWTQECIRHSKRYVDVKSKNVACLLLARVSRVLVSNPLQFEQIKELEAQGTDSEVLNYFHTKLFSELKR